MYNPNVHNGYTCIITAYPVGDVLYITYTMCVSIYIYKFHYFLDSLF